MEITNVAAEPFVRIAHVARRLADGIDLADLADLVVSEEMSILGADGGIFAMLRPGGIVEPVAMVGYESELMQRVGPMTLYRELPLTVAIREGAPMWVPSLDDAAARFPALHKAASGSHAWAAMPLIAGGTAFGALGVSFLRPHEFTEHERTFLCALADLSALALALAHAPPQPAASLDIAGRPLEDDVRDRPWSTMSEIALVDLHGVIVGVNRAWRQFAMDNGGDPATTGVGVSYLDLCRSSPDDPGSIEVAEVLQGILRGDRRDGASIVVPCHSPDDQRWFELIVSPRLDQSGQVIGATVAFVPTDAPDARVGRRRTAGELTPAGTRRMVDASPDGMVLVDDTGLIVFANAQVRSLFGFGAGEAIVGLTVDDLVPDAQRPAHRAHRASYVANPTSRPMAAGGALLARRRNGTTFPAEISLSPMSDEYGIAVIATIRDISERVQLEERAQRDRARLISAEERARISRDLHDVTIQRLFAAGLRAQRMLVEASTAPLRDGLGNVVDELETAIAEIRATISSLPAPAHDQHDRRLAQTISSASGSLGFLPEIEIDGELDTVPSAVFDDLLASLTEALANVARHARASRARITIERAADQLTLEVVDDGVGIRADHVRGMGLDNLEARAARSGGDVQFFVNGLGGTTVRWSVPLPATG